MIDRKENQLPMTQLPDHLQLSRDWAPDAQKEDPGRRLSSRHGSFDPPSESGSEPPRGYKKLHFRASKRCLLKL
jgi:hypothetical protein